MFEERNRDIAIDRLLAEQHQAPALRHEADAGVFCIRRVFEPRDRAGEPQATLVGPQLAKQHPRQLDLPAAHETVDPEHFARMGLKRHVAKEGLQRQPLRLQHHRRLFAGFERDIVEITLPKFVAAGADHVLDDPRLVDSGSNIGVRDAQAVAEHRHLVGNFENVVEKMRDENDPAPALAHPTQHRKQPRDLGGRQGRGRLVENDDARAGEQHAGEFDQLLHADGKIAEPCARVDVEPEVLQLLARLARHARPGDGSQPVERLAAQKHVLGHAQVGRDAEFLMHHGDAARPGVARGAEVDGLAVHPELTGIGAVHAGDHFHQRAFARAVFAGEPVNAAGFQREIDPAQGMDAAERLDDIVKFDQRRHVGPSGAVTCVMPGLVPGIHAVHQHERQPFASPSSVENRNMELSRLGVDGRDKPGHDGDRVQIRN